MCRYIIHTELAGLDYQAIEERLGWIASHHLGSLEGDVEVFWPQERLGLNAPKITIDAEFTVGTEEGDIAPDPKVFRNFGDRLLTVLELNVVFDNTNLHKGDAVATWVKPDQGQTIYLAGSRSR